MKILINKITKNRKSFILLFIYEDRKRVNVSKIPGKELGMPFLEFIILICTLFL